MSCCSYTFVHVKQKGFPGAFQGTSSRYTTVSASKNTNPHYWGSASLTLQALPTVYGSFVASKCQLLNNFKVRNQFSNSAFRLDTKPILSCNSLKGMKISFSSHFNH